MLGVRSLGTNFADQDAGEHRKLANLLATTKKENVIGQRGGMSMGMSGKSGMKSSVTFKTPYKSGKAGGYFSLVQERQALTTHAENGIKHSQTSLKPSRAVLQSRVLGDKTPLPNRQMFSNLSPLPRSASKKSSKTPLPSLLEVVKGSTPQPPSTGRKKSRTPSSIKRVYQTPITKGDHWNVSDVSIDLAGTSLEEVAEEVIDADDFSDVEYMPPTATGVFFHKRNKILLANDTAVPPYEPPFELPNYKELGANLWRAAHSYPVNNPPNYDAELDSDELLKDAGWSPSGGTGLQLAELGMYT